MFGQFLFTTSYPVTLYETNIAPNTGWLEDDCFCLWDGFNREGTDAFAVSFREGVFFGFFCQYS